MAETLSNFDLTDRNLSSASSFSSSQHEEKMAAENDVIVAQQSDDGGHAFGSSSPHAEKKSALKIDTADRVQISEEHLAAAAAREVCDRHGMLSIHTKQPPIVSESIDEIGGSGGRSSRHQQQHENQWSCAQSIVSTCSQVSAMSTNFSEKDDDYSFELACTKPPACKTSPTVAAANRSCSSSIVSAFSSTNTSSSSSSSSSSSGVIVSSSASSRVTETTGGGVNHLSSIASFIASPTCERPPPKPKRYYLPLSLSEADLAARVLRELKAAQQWDHRTVAVNRKRALSDSSTSSKENFIDVRHQQKTSGLLHLTQAHSSASSHISSLDNENKFCAVYEEPFYSHQNNSRDTFLQNEQQEGGKSANHSSPADKKHAQASTLDYSWLKEDYGEHERHLDQLWEKRSSAFEHKDSRFRGAKLQNKGWISRNFRRLFSSNHNLSATFSPEDSEVERNPIEVFRKNGGKPRSKHARSETPVVWCVGSDGGASMRELDSKKKDKNTLSPTKDVGMSKQHSRSALNIAADAVSMAIGTAISLPPVSRARSPNRPRSSTPVPVPLQQNGCYVSGLDVGPPLMQFSISPICGPAEDIASLSSGVGVKNAPSSMFSSVSSANSIFLSSDAANGEHENVDSVNRKKLKKLRARRSGTSPATRLLNAVVGWGGSSGGTHRTETDECGGGGKIKNGEGSITPSSRVTNSERLIHINKKKSDKKSTSGNVQESEVSQQKSGSSGGGNLRPGAVASLAQRLLDRRLGWRRAKRSFSSPNPEAAQKIQLRHIVLKRSTRAAHDYVCAANDDDEQERAQSSLSSKPINECSSGSSNIIRGSSSLMHAYDGTSLGATTHIRNSSFVGSASSVSDVASSPLASISLCNSPASSCQHQQGQFFFPDRTAARSSAPGSNSHCCNGRDARTSACSGLSFGGCSDGRLSLADSSTSSRSPSIILHTADGAVFSFNDGFCECANGDDDENGVDGVFEAEEGEEKCEYKTTTCDREIVEDDENDSTLVRDYDENDTTLGRDDDDAETNVVETLSELPSTDDQNEHNRTLIAFNKSKEEGGCASACFTRSPNCCPPPLIIAGDNDIDSQNDTVDQQTLMRQKQRESAEQLVALLRSSSFSGEYSYL